MEYYTVADRRVRLARRTQLGEPPVPRDPLQSSASRTCAPSVPSAPSLPLRGQTVRVRTRRRALLVAAFLDRSSSSGLGGGAGPAATGRRRRLDRRVHGLPARGRRGTGNGSPAIAAGVFLRLDERKAVRTTIEAEGRPRGRWRSQTVVVTLDGIPDDSVRAERWTLGFEEDGDGVYALTGALRELRCQDGRGHQDFQRTTASDGSA